MSSGFTKSSAPFWSKAIISKKLTCLATPFLCAALLTFEFCLCDVPFVSSTSKAGSELKNSTYSCLSYCSQGIRGLLKKLSNSFGNLEMISLCLYYFIEQHEIRYCVYNSRRTNLITVIKPTLTRQKTLPSYEPLSEANDLPAVWSFFRVNVVKIFSLRIADGCSHLAH